MKFKHDDWQKEKEPITFAVGVNPPNIRIFTGITGNSSRLLVNSMFGNVYKWNPSLSNKEIVNLAKLRKTIN